MSSEFPRLWITGSVVARSAFRSAWFFEFGSPWIGRAQMLQGALQADEGAARIAAFLEPVRVDEARRIIVGSGCDGFQEGGVIHPISSRRCVLADRGGKSFCRVPNSLSREQCRPGVDGVLQALARAESPHRLRQPSER